MQYFGVKKSAVASALAGWIADIAGEELLEQGLGGPPFGPIDAVIDAGALNGALDQAHRLEFFEVLGDGGLGQLHFLDNVAADAGVDLQQVLEDGDAGGVPQGLGQGGQLILLDRKIFSFGKPHGGNGLAPDSWPGTTIEQQKYKITAFGERGGGLSSRQKADRLVLFPKMGYFTFRRPNGGKKPGRALF